MNDAAAFAVLDRNHEARVLEDERDALLLEVERLQNEIAGLVSVAGRTQNKAATA